MYSKYRSGIPGENLASKWRCAVSVKYKSDFEELVQKSLRDTVICILITCWNDKILCIQLNKILLKLISSVFFYFFNVAVKKI